jgi:hypothetical protein
MTAEPLGPAAESDDDLLTRKEASAYLQRFHIGLKPATLARIWCVGGDGPPCQHIRGKPRYPRGALRAWALGQRTALRGSRATPGPAMQRGS